MGRNIAAGSPRSTDIKDGITRRAGEAWAFRLPPAEAAKRASRTIGWPQLAAGVVWLTGKTP
jgi:hypothetical protein